MVCEVVAVADDNTPGIEVPGAPPHRAMGMIEVKFTMPVSREGVRPGQELLLADFIRVMNPKSEQILENLARGGGGRGPAMLPPGPRKPS